MYKRVLGVIWGVQKPKRWLTSVIAGQNKYDYEREPSCYIFQEKWKYITFTQVFKTKENKIFPNADT